jgi:hypothetical protein
MPKAPTRAAATVAVLIAFGATHASAATSLHYFAWDNVAGFTYAATAAGIDGALTFSTAADDVILRNDTPPTAAPFIATYGPTIPALAINNGTGGSAASATADVEFQSPLPTGSRLIAFDVDAGGPVNERVQFTHSPGTFTLIDQLESQAGASSVFPSWSAVNLTLTAQRTNNNEASVFDVAGVQSLSVTYLRAVTAGGVSGIRFAIGVPVLNGDANLNGRIDPDDYAALDRGRARNLTGFPNGDFNRDGTIDPADYLLIDQSLAAQSGFSPDLLAARTAQFGPAYAAQLLPTIPEPASLVPLLTLPLATRRRNRQPRHS